MYTILIVEDDQSFRKICKDFFLRHENIKQVLTAPDGIAATALLHTHKIDFVLTDFVMPRMNGYKLVKHIKRFYPEIPTFVMTVHQHAVKELTKAGALFVFIKPFDVGVVLRKSITFMETFRRRNKSGAHPAFIHGSHKPRLSLIIGGKNQWKN